MVETISYSPDEVKLPLFVAKALYFSHGFRRIYRKLRNIDFSNQKSQDLSLVVFLILFYIDFFYLKPVFAIL